MSNKAGKGSQFERDVCRKLSLWWSDGKDDDLLWRTAQSGGRATTRRKSGKVGSRHCGDICSIDPSSELLLQIFSFELKRGYPGVTTQELLDNPDGGAKGACYKDWIVKAEQDAEAAGSFSWLIIHKRDRRQTVVTMPKQGIDWSRSEFGPMPSPYLDIILSREVQYVTMSLDSFLEWIEPEQLRQTWPERKTA